MFTVPTVQTTDMTAENSATATEDWIEHVGWQDAEEPRLAEVVGENLDWSKLLEDTKEPNW